MERFFRLVVTAIFGLGMWFFAEGAQATERVACGDELTLVVVIEQGVPIDEDGSVAVGCKLLPTDFRATDHNAQIERGIGFFTEEGVTYPIWIVRAQTGESVYWYEVGLFETIPQDQIDEAIAGLENPILMVGIPGIETSLEDTMLAAVSSDSSLEGQVVEVTILAGD